MFPISPSVVRTLPKCFKYVFVSLCWSFMMFFFQLEIKSEMSLLKLFLVSSHNLLFKPNSAVYFVQYFQFFSLLTFSSYITINTSLLLTFWGAHPNSRREWSYMQGIFLHRISRQVRHPGHFFLFLCLPTQRGFVGISQLLAPLAF